MTIKQIVKEAMQSMNKSKGEEDGKAKAESHFYRGMYLLSQQEQSPQRSAGEQLLKSAIAYIKVID